MAKSASNIEGTATTCSCQDSVVSNDVSSSCVDIVNTLSNNSSYIADAIASSHQTIATVISASGSNIHNSILDLNSKTHESLGLLSSEITGTIVQSNDKLSVTAIAFAVFVALVGALSAFLFNHIHWRVVRKINNSYSTGAELVELIQELELEALKYWVSSYDRNTKEEISISEIKIKSIIRQINTQTMTLIEIINNRKIKAKKDQIYIFPSEIYDLVTGGDFESKSRKSSKRRAMRIAKRCSDARANISSIIIRL